MREFHIIVDFLFTANEDFSPLIETYLPALFGEEECFTIETYDNNEVEEAKYFGFAFQNVQETDVTKFGITSVRIAILDNDGKLHAP